MKDEIKKIIKSTLGGIVRTTEYDDCITFTVSAKKGTLLGIMEYSEAKKKIVEAGFTCEAEITKFEGNVVNPTQIKIYVDIPLSDEEKAIQQEYLIDHIGETVYPETAVEKDTEKDFNFEKNGLKFCFKNLHLDRYDKLVMDWKIIGSTNRETNNNCDEGYFGNAELDLTSKAIRCDFRLGKKQMNGVRPPEDVFTQLENIFNSLIEERKKLFSKTVDELAEGTKNIRFSIVGCDYPEYQAWLDDCPEDLKGQEQQIVEKAIRKLTNNDFVDNSCDYIGRKLNQRIGYKSEINSKAFDLEFDKESQDYHGYVDTIVTNFKMKLSDAIKLDETIAKKATAEAKRKAIFDKAKETGEKQELEHRPEPCNDPNEECDIDLVYAYAMPDGSIKTERQHTW